MRSLALAIIIVICAYPATAGQWQTMALRDHDGRIFAADSELKPRKHGFGPYSMKNLFDQHLDTCWAEGETDDGRGRTLILDLPEGVENIAIANGYQKSPKLFEANNRVAVLGVEVLVAINRPGELSETRTIYHARAMPKVRVINLADRSGFQKIRIINDPAALKRFRHRTLAEFRKKTPGAEGLDVRTLVRLTIKKTFTGRGYNDTCISEIRFPLPKIRIRLSPGEDAILLDRAGGATETLIRDPNSVFQIIAVDPGDHFLIAIRMAATASPRSETEYQLYDLDQRRLVPAARLGAEVGEMYDFDLRNGRLWLSYLNKRSQEIEELDLDRIPAKDLPPKKTREKP